MNIEQFGQIIKQKYPEYQDISDIELSQKVLNKYPQYQDMITTETVISPQETTSGSLLQRLSGGVTSNIKSNIEAGIGIGKGILSSATGLGSLVERGIRSNLQQILPKTTEQKIGIANVQYSDPTFLEKIIPLQYRKPQGLEQKVGYAVEKGAEFLAPSGKISALEKGMTTLPRIATEAGIVGLQTAIQQGQLNSETATGAIIGGLIPMGGSILQRLKGTTKTIGEKIIISKIKPSVREIEDGFKVENITKYNLGGSLENTLAKTQNKLNDLMVQLNQNLQASEQKINLNQILQETNNTFKTTEVKTRLFGENKAIQRVLKNLKDEIKSVSKTSEVNLMEATAIKRGAGTKGAWAYGRVEPDATAVEKVYSTFYNKLKTAIEKASPSDIQGINKQMSDLIPISNAILRRLPVETRNNMISLTDSIGLFASVFDPKALALIGINKLARSGKFGAFLAKIGQRVAPTTGIGKRIFGQ